MNQNTDRQLRDRAPLPSDRQGFNRRWYADSLEQYFVPEDTAGVYGALLQAFASGFQNGSTRIVSGGHCYEDFVYESGTTRAIIDVSQLSQFEIIDAGNPPEPIPAARFALGAGASNWQGFQAMFKRANRVLPSGSCYSVGAGGHISVGGYGFLSRQFGLTSDLVVGFEIVTMGRTGQPEIRYPHAQSTDQIDRELFWALRGAGAGNFGVITRYYFGDDLPVAPLYADISTYAWDWSGFDSGTDLENLFTVVRDIFSPSGSLSFPNSEFAIFRLFHQQHGQLNMTIQNVYFDQATYQSERNDYLQRTQARLDAFNAAGFPAVYASERPVDPDWQFHPRFERQGPIDLSRAHTRAAEDITRNYTFYEAVQTLNGSGSNKRGEYKSAYMRDPGFTSAQFDTLHEYLTRQDAGTDFSDTRINVDSYGGEINTPGPGDTPIPQRDSIFKLQYQSYWTSTQDVGAPDPIDQPNIAWLSEFYSAMYQAGGGVPGLPNSGSIDNSEGCYYGYPDIELGYDGGDRPRDTAMQLYFGPDNYSRLKALKSAVDPSNFFQSRQSVEPG